MRLLVLADLLQTATAGSVAGILTGCYCIRITDPDSVMRPGRPIPSRLCVAAAEMLTSKCGVTHSLSASWPISAAAAAYKCKGHNINAAAAAVLAVLVIIVYPADEAVLVIFIALVCCYCYLWFVCLQLAWQNRP